MTNSSTLKIVTLCVGLFASVMSTSLLSVLSPLILDHFTIGYTSWQTRNILFFSVFASFMVLTGKISDLIEPYHLLRIGLILFVLTCFGSFLAIKINSYSLFLIFQTLQASSDAVMVPSVMAMIRMSFDDKKLGWAFGCFGATMSASSVAGSALGGLFAKPNLWGYSVVLLAVLASIGLFMMNISFQKPRTFRRLKEASFKYQNILSTAVLILLIYLTQKTELYADNYLIVMILVILLGVFILSEKSSKNNTLMPWNLFKNSLYNSACLRIFLYSIVFNMGPLIFPIALNELYKISANHISWMLITQSLVVAVLGPFSGKFSDKNLFLGLGISFILQLMALFMISGLWLDINLAMFFTYFALLGIASSFNISASLKLISKSMAPTDSGRGMGFYLFMQFISGSFTAGIIGALFLNSSNELSFSSWKIAIMTAILLTFGQGALILFERVRFNNIPLNS